MFQNIDEVPRHVPSKGCSEILEQTRSITQLNANPVIEDNSLNDFTTKELKQGIRRHSV